MVTMLGRARVLAEKIRALVACRHSRITVGGSMRLARRARLIVERGGRANFLGRFQADRDVEIVVYAGGMLACGDDVYVGHGTTIACAAQITIGRGTLIADLVSIRDMNHRRQTGVPLGRSGMDMAPIEIGPDCLIGSKVTMVAGSKIGHGVTVGANAVVTAVFPDNVTIGGVPARIIGSRRSG